MIDFGDGFGSFYSYLQDWWFLNAIWNCSVVSFYTFAILCSIFPTDSDGAFYSFGELNS
jgi:hypothetical protein